ncbi:MAG TPA: hypothetical protein VHC22_13465 [Pirellulales bacterium]|nr:hypothetical protein [Pirellulales bacterium]
MAMRCADTNDQKCPGCSEGNGLREPKAASGNKGNDPKSPYLVPYVMLDLETVHDEVCTGENGNRHRRFLAAVFLALLAWPKLLSMGQKERRVENKETCHGVAAIRGTGYPMAKGTDRSFSIFSFATRLQISRRCSTQQPRRAWSARLGSRQG